MKRTIVNVSCGLGNQLFQYAFGYAMSKRNDSKLVVYKYEDQPDHRPYQIEQYSIVMDGLIDFNNKSIADRIWLKISKKIDDKGFEFNRDILKQRVFSTFYNGYWQNWRYFDEYYSDLFKMFKYKGKYSDRCTAYMYKISSLKNGLSIHVRRGDYTRANLNLSIKYYRDSIKHISEKIGDVDIFIFSDDKEFIKENFEFLSAYTLVEGVSDVEEFEIMRVCRHHIIANSTFSWWAAYLGIDREGTVIAPIIHHWTRDFYLPNWNCIQADFAENYV